MSNSPVSFDRYRNEFRADTKIGDYEKLRCSSRCLDELQMEGVVMTLPIYALKFQNFFSRIQMRIWMSHLTPAEYSVFSMIADRTFDWGRLWWRIPIAEFMKGAFEENGYCYHQGTGLSERTIQRALKTLLEKGCIGIKRYPGCKTEYAVNIFWRPLKEFDDEGHVLARSKYPKTFFRKGDKLAEDAILESQNPLWFLVQRKKELLEFYAHQDVTFDEYGEEVEEYDEHEGYEDYPEDDGR